MKKLQVIFDDDEAQKILTLAQKDKRSISNFVRNLVTTKLKEIQSDAR